jgi:hypothetical protein
VKTVILYICVLLSFYPFRSSRGRTKPFLSILSIEDIVIAIEPISSDFSEGLRQLLADGLFEEMLKDVNLELRQ